MDGFDIPGGVLRSNTFHKGFQRICQSHPQGRTQGFIGAAFTVSAGLGADLIVVFLLWRLSLTDSFALK